MVLISTHIMFTHISSAGAQFEAFCARANECGGENAITSRALL